ncbi:phage integrase N-terminal SAM-like domain-containing protein [Companilactobacillus ginsenosidimutans]|uniref:Recombinase XerD n=1 Tax=Companilactobacillus ginsenosidimutans TaxID=1007676 RepID=A0A0H4QF35_9LACO|nr:phage integrase N-terminal SAM-like domain-containing protein [Companilactobacillus ginsenosidimutans]AKP66552.1 recombinase XerD [Companilactobacillus ginsenosidimutans]
MKKIPYYEGFKAYLNTRRISARAKEEYNKSLDDFFNYLVENNSDFKLSEKVSDIHSADVTEYKDFLINSLHLSPSTINKILSNLNIYFKYLFSIGKNKEFPTMEINSLTVPTQESFPVEVFLNLESYINNIGLHIYTRLLILIISKGFTYQDALSENFYLTFNKLNFDDNEKKFLDEYHEFILPWQTYWNTKDLFLSRNKGAKSPLLSVSALHRDIKSDSDCTKLDLSPKKLYTTYILLLLTNKSPSKSQLNFINNMDSASLLYYRRLLRETNFTGE